MIAGNQQIQKSWGAKFASIILSAILVTSAMCFPSVSATDFRQLRIGVLNSHPLATDARKRKAFIKAYSGFLGVNVSIQAFKSLAGLIDAQSGTQVHYAVHTAKSFAATASLCNCIEAIARPVSEAGSYGFRSVLVARKSKSDDIAHLTVGYSNDESISGKILPDMAIRKHALHVSSVKKFGDVNNVVNALERGEIDAFFGWLPVKSDQQNYDMNSLFSGFYRDRISKVAELKILWSSPVIYYGPHAVHNSVPETVKQGLTDILLNIDGQSPGLVDEIEPYFSGGFEKTKTEDYWPVMQAYMYAINPNMLMIFDPLRATITN